MFMPLAASLTACARPCPRATPVMNATFFSAGIAPPSAVALTCDPTLTFLMRYSQ